MSERAGRSRPLVLWLVAALVAPALSLSGGPTYGASDQSNFSVTMVGDPGDYIAGGRTHLWRSGAGSIGVQRNPSAADELMVNVSGGPSQADFSLTFAAPRGASLGVGVFAAAERAHFRTGGHPGIDISGEGHACSATSGSFRVLDYAPDLSRLWIIYEQHCDGATPAVFGEIRYRQPRDQELASVPSRVEWPTGWLRRPGTTVPVTWINTGTKPVAVSGAEISNGDADFDVVTTNCHTLAPGQTCTVQVSFHPAVPGPRTGTLTVQDSTARATHSVALVGTGAPGRTGWNLTSDGDDPVSAGVPHTFSPQTDELAFYGTRQKWGFDVNPDAAWSTGRRWQGTFAAPRGEDLAIGTTYTDVALYTSPARDDTPGATMRVVGNTAVCSTVSGSFTVESAEFDEHGVATEAAVSFEQRCNGASGALRGTILWRAPQVDTSAPNPVTGLSASVVGEGVTLSWSNPADADWADTVVRTAPGNVAPASTTEGTDVRHGLMSLTSTGRLSLGGDHSFSVFTVDDKANTSAPRTITVRGSLLTAGALRRSIIHGATTSIAGTLVDPSSRSPLAGVQVTLLGRSRPNTSWSVLGRRTTDARGRYAVTVRPGATTDYYATNSGASDRLPGRTSPVLVAVAPMAVLSASRRVVPRRKRVAMTVVVEPRLPAQAVVLQRSTPRGWASIRQALLSPTSAATFRIRQQRGLGVYRVFVPAATIHTASVTNAVRVRFR